VHFFHQLIDGNGCIKQSVSVLAVKDPLNFATEATEGGPVLQVGGVNGMQLVNDVVTGLEERHLGDESKVVWVGNELADDEVEAAVTEFNPLRLLVVVPFLVEDHAQQLASLSVLEVERHILNADQQFFARGYRFHYDAL
jgi:hypothetical protein